MQNLEFNQCLISLGRSPLPSKNIMKSMTQDQLLQSVVERMSQLRRRIESLRQNPIKALTAIPGKNRWSALQCFEHLNAYGDYYLPAMENALTQHQESHSANLTYTSGWLGGYFVRLMQPKKAVPGKMKSPADKLPSAAPSDLIIIDQCLKQLTALERLTKAAHRVDISKARVPISIGKWIRLKWGDALLVLITHMERHVQQAERAAGLD